MLNPSQASAGSTAARECAAIASDLERLKALIAEAGDKLLASFNQVIEITPRLAGQLQDRDELKRAVGTAVTALQFQDMATQLTQHAQSRLAKLEQALSTLTEETPDPLMATTRMQPVRQTGMGAGSIDLF
jgi:signal transduction histidine kinase